MGYTISQIALKTEALIAELVFPSELTIPSIAT
jgi:hypothetical protein